MGRDFPISLNCFTFRNAFCRKLSEKIKLLFKIRSNLLLNSNFSNYLYLELFPQPFANKYKAKELRKILNWIVFYGLMGEGNEIRKL